MADYLCPEPLSLLVTCEHGGNLVPSSLRHLFTGQEEILDTHQAYDPGALELATALAAALQAPYFYSAVSRLVVDLNRSSANFRVFSRFTRGLDPNRRRQLLIEYHRPYRHSIARTAARLTSGGGRLIHIAVHSFTPVLNGTARTADIGLLYDPARKSERTFCRLWQNTLRQLTPELRVRRNYPYLGKTDGLPTKLRRKYPDDRYTGIELEINQRLFLSPGRRPAELVISSFNGARAAFTPSEEQEHFRNC